MARRLAHQLRAYAARRVPESAPQCARRGAERGELSRAGRVDRVFPDEPRVPGRLGGGVPRRDGRPRRTYRTAARTRVRDRQPRVGRRCARSECGVEPLHE